MLVEFSVENFRSFKDLQTLQMQAAKIKSKYSEVDANNIFKISKNISLLKSKAIYGANASGKSNLIIALKLMIAMITDSFKNEHLAKFISPEVFSMNDENHNKPIFFQLTFIHRKIMYRYGFEILEGKLVAEWLFGKPEKREVYYFVRENQEIKINKKTYKEALFFLQKESIEQPFFKPEVLFLSVLSAFNRKLASEITNFISSIRISSGLYDENILEVLKSFSDNNLRSKLTDIIKSIDRNIFHIEKVKIDEKQLPKFVPDIVKDYFSDGEKIVVHRNKYNSDGKKIGNHPILLDTNEGQGTKKMVILGSLIFQIFQEGGTLIVDEFDARLHPNLTRKILSLFHSKKTNPKNAQLIFATHDTNLLDARLLRRDQICFVEKDKYGASKLTSLAEFKGIRNDASFEKDYLKGKYGGVPNLNKFEWAFEQNETE